jgi:hypothetical protein
MNKSALTAMTVAELKALAKKKRVSLPAGAKKTDIISALTARATVKKPATKKPATEKAVTKRSAAKKSIASKKTAGRKTTAAKKRLQATQVKQEGKRPSGVEAPLMSQERVSQAKYYTGPAPQHPAATDGELPHGYGEEKIALMMRDPYVAYAYWEVTPERMEREKTWFGWDSKLCIRIYDVTGIQFDGRNAAGYFDQEIFDRIGNWYFDLGRPNHSFCADLGLISPTGRFLTLARSNFITMPRDGVAEIIDEEWMLLDEEFMKLYGIPSGLSSPELQEMMKRRREVEITSPGMFSRSRAKRK